MRWIPDRTGRFRSRPYLERAELDAAAEGIIEGFLTGRFGLVRYPIQTDDLVAMLESVADDVDMYSDLPGQDPDVEGMTIFGVGSRPSIYIARTLTTTPSRENRLRTTLTHELGHAEMHNQLWDPNRALVLDPTTRIHTCLRRGAAPDGEGVDWMEWQSGYLCGAVLMPVTAVRQLVSRTQPGSDRESIVAQGFQVSKEAAHVRLDQLGLTRG